MEYDLCSNKITKYQIRSLFQCSQYNKKLRSKLAHFHGRVLILFVLGINLQIFQANIQLFKLEYKLAQHCKRNNGVFNFRRMTSVSKKKKSCV